VPFRLLETSKIAPDEDLLISRHPSPIEVSIPLTIRVGKEYVFFNRLCDILSAALHKWTISNSGEDEHINETVDDNVLDVPLKFQTLIFGRRKDRKEYWEGSVLIEPIHSHVAKLRTDNLKGSWIYGVYLGEIDNFWVLVSMPFLVSMKASTSARFFVGQKSRGIGEFTLS